MFIDGILLQFPLCPFSANKSAHAEAAECDLVVENPIEAFHWPKILNVTFIASIKAVSAYFKEHVKVWVRCL